MKLFRFMSLEEFRKYQRGEELYNNTNHKEKYNYKTPSVGFCFFDFEKYRPEQMIHSLTGIASLEICLVVETEKSNVKESYGQYVLYKKWQINSKVQKITEYCTTNYNNKDFKFVSWAKPDWFNWEKWTYIKF